VNCAARSCRLSDNEQGMGERPDDVCRRCRCPELLGALDCVAEFQKGGFLSLDAGRALCP
jgi:hypothetical protein